MMVDLLGLAHDRGCEAELAAVLDEDLAAQRIPDMAVLHKRFAPDPESLPEVFVHLASLSSYEALLSQPTRAAA